MGYHLVCQVLSHVAWLLVISQVMKELLTGEMSFAVGSAYVAGYTLGSLCGARVAMHIEGIIGAKADG